MMKSQKNCRCFFYAAAFVTLFFSLNVPAAFAADQAAGWRPTYDLVMKWVNFALLAFIVVKYAREPLKEFLFGQKAIVAREIEKLESEKEKTIATIDDTRKMLANSDQRLSDLKERMLRQGEKEKERIIEAAREQSRFMLEGAKRKVEHRIQQAKANFRDELIDLAVNAAIQQLPTQVTPEDNQKIVSKFLEDTQGIAS